MSSVMFSVRKTTVDALSTVSSAADFVSRGLGSAAALTEALELHAQSYRDNTRIEIEAARNELAVTAVAKAQHKVTRVLMHLDQECKDPAFAEMLKKVQSNWGRSNPTLTLVAAE